jgi:hypothetical protein
MNTRKRSAAAKYVRGLLSAQHGRLGETSPAALLDQMLHREIFLFAFGDEIARRFVARGEWTSVSEDGLTLVQHANCKNFVSTVSPPVRCGSFETWRIRVDVIGSGTLRYIGVHDAAGESTAWPDVTRPLVFICIQDEDLDDSAIAEAQQGSEFMVALNATPDQTIAGIAPLTIMFWHNGAHIKTMPVPAAATELFPAVVLQTKDDQVTISFDCDVPPLPPPPLR